MARLQRNQSAKKGALVVPPTAEGGNSTKRGAIKQNINDMKGYVKLLLLGKIIKETYWPNHTCFIQIVLGNLRKK